MRVTISILVTIVTLILAHSAAADTGDDTMTSVIWAEWVSDGDLTTIDAFSWVKLKSNSKLSVEYEVPTMTLIPLVYYRLPDGDGGEKDVLNYNFRGPINWLAWEASSKLAGGEQHGDGWVLGSPWCYALFAPNFLVRYRLIGNLKLVVGTRTDYLLYRTSSTERGIMFTPQIGFDFSGGQYGDPNAYSGISVALGWRNWWNFDGECNSDEITLSARLWGIPFTH